MGRSKVAVFRLPADAQGWLKAEVDQTVPTWLGLRRRAFEWFGRVPRRLIIDNPKCAITRARVRDPLVQRAYAECAEGCISSRSIRARRPILPKGHGLGRRQIRRRQLPTHPFRDLADLNA
jgi:transposase